MNGITAENPGNELPSFLEKNPDAFGNVWGRHFWKKYPFRSISIIFMSLLKKWIFGKWVSVISEKKSRQLFKSGFICQEWRLLSSRTKKFSKIHDHIQEKSLDFFFRNDAYSFPKKRLQNFWHPYRQADDSIINLEHMICSIWFEPYHMTLKLAWMMTS